ncbi:MAG: hypothetical protein ACRDNS_07825 [Trebonia sp.]
MRLRGWRGRLARRRQLREMRRRAGIRGTFRPFGADGLSDEAARMVDQIEGELRELARIIEPRLDLSLLRVSLGVLRACRTGGG